MKKIVFPYDEEFAPVLPFLRNQWKEDEIILLKPRSWFPYHQNKIVCEEEMYSIYSELNIKEAVDILFVNSIINIDTKSLVDFIKNINVNCIYIYRMINMIEREYLKKTFPTSQLIEFGMENNNNEEVLYDIQTPVIGVSGVNEYTGKFNTHLEIVSNLRKQGYSVGFIGSRNEAYLCEGISVPNILYDNKYSIKEKVICLNHCLKKYEINNKLDVIVLGIPGEIVILNKNYLGNAGEIPFVVSEAVGVSDLILCMMYDENLVNQIKIYGDKIAKRFGKNIDQYVIINRMLDPDETELRHRIKYTSIPEIKVKEKMDLKCFKNTYKLFDKQSLKKLVEDIIDILS